MYTKCPSWCLGEPHEPLSAVIIVIVWTKKGCKCWSSLCSLTLRFVEWAVAKTYLQSVLIDFSFNISFATLLPRYARVWKALSRALAARLFLPKIFSFASFDKTKCAYSKNFCESFSLVVWALASYDRLGIGGFRHCSHVQPPYGACSSIRCIKCVTKELANPEFHGLTSKLYAQDPNTYKPWVTVSKPHICQCVSCLGNSVNLTKCAGKATQQLASRSAFKTLQIPWHWNQNASACMLESEWSCHHWVAITSKIPRLVFHSLRLRYKSLLQLFTTDSCWKHNLIWFVNSCCLVHCKQIQVPDMTWGKYSNRAKTCKNNVWIVGSFEGICKMYCFVGDVDWFVPTHK